MLIVRIFLLGVFALLSNRTIFLQKFIILFSQGFFILYEILKLEGKRDEIVKYVFVTQIVSLFFFTCWEDLCFAVALTIVSLPPLAEYLKFNMKKAGLVIISSWLWVSALIYWCPLKRAWVPLLMYAPLFVLPEEVYIIGFTFNVYLSFKNEASQWNSIFYLLLTLVKYNSYEKQTNILPVAQIPAEPPKVVPMQKIEVSQKPPPAPPPSKNLLKRNTGKSIQTAFQGLKF